MCGGYLGRDRPITATTCSCHGVDEPYNPRHDKHLDQRILAILMHAAHSGPVNVARMLGTEDRMAVWCAIKRLRRQGWDIRGSRGHGYVLG
jgi:biotin operon repressor